MVTRAQLLRRAAVLAVMPWLISESIEGNQLASISIPMEPPFDPPYRWCRYVTPDGVDLTGWVKVPRDKIPPRYLT